MDCKNAKSYWEIENLQKTTSYFDNEGNYETGDGRWVEQLYGNKTLGRNA
jgi:hypothetical protein